MHHCLSLLFPVGMILSCQGRPAVQPPMSIHPIAGCPSPQKITTIQKDDVYDLSGYEYVTGVSAFNLFDEPGSFDPAEPGKVIPATSPHPPHDPKYYKDDGSSIVVDLRATHQLTDVFLYDKAKVVDSVFVYTGSMNNWTLKAAFTTKGNSSLWGWRQVALNDSARYLKFRFKSWETDIAEAVLYGCALAPLAKPAPPGIYRSAAGAQNDEGVPGRELLPGYSH